MTAESGDLSEIDTNRIAKTFLIGEYRKCDEDPRFGLILLSEIGIMTDNVLATNRKANSLIELVLENRSDVLVTLESDQWWQSKLDILEVEYSYTIKCPLDNLYVMHVYRYLSACGSAQACAEHI